MGIKLVQFYFIFMISLPTSVDCWINYEPCGLFCGSMSYLFLLYGMYTTTFCVIIPMLGFGLHSLIHIFLFNFLCIMAIASHWKAMTTDPGAVPKNALPLLDDEEERGYDPSSSKLGESFRKFCKRCRAFKPTRAHHCSICNRCIIKMDHHCPWVNNCVGIGNHKLFLLFIFFVFVVSAYSILLVSAYYVVCSARGSSCGVDYVNMLVIFLFIEAAICATFTLCMMGDQVPNITTNETQIDRLKRLRDSSSGKDSEKGDGSQGRRSISSALYNRYLTAEHAVRDFNEVFGCSVRTSFHYSWLLPIPIRYPRDVYVRSKVLGYCLESEIDLEQEFSPLMNSNISRELQPMRPLNSNFATAEKDSSADGASDEEAISAVASRISVSEKDKAKSYGVVEEVSTDIPLPSSTDAASQLLQHIQPVNRSHIESNIIAKEIGMNVRKRL